jgi:glutathione-specific gamma-glutamylcyclotransferase
VQALTSQADQAATEIRTDQTRTEQIHCIAHCAGFLGTSRAYLADILDHFAALDLHDADCAALLSEGEAYLEVSDAKTREAGRIDPL